jgi:formylglycine-generating enzyme required for sulfatase activity
LREPVSSVENAALVDDMIWIDGGEFMMGSDRHYPEEAPAHRVRVDGFWIDRHQVTNELFRRFVKETGYVTVAQRPPDPADYPGAKPELLVRASTVFVPPTRRVDLRNPYEWWTFVPGADWRHPRGPGTTIRGASRHPVVHVAWDDVAAYARWAGKELPTEAEWEFAARGGLEGAEFVWGEDLTPGGRHMANVWQGEFPYENRVEDGFPWTAPVGSFPPNGYGLHDMAGNVWEWTVDWYQEHGAIEDACCTIDDPRGGTADRSMDPEDASKGIRIPRKVIKGGSHLCAENYCRRYRPAARMAQAIDTSTSHVGFRCVVRDAGAFRKGE